MGIFFKIIGAFLTIAILRCAWMIITVAGIFSPIEPLLVEQCTRMNIAPGTEDIVIDHKSGIVFVGAGDRRNWYADESSQNPSQERNGIYAFDPKIPGSLKLVSPPNMKNFLPHGIDLWHGENGERRLFVVNHAGGRREHVEIFDIDTDHMLKLIKTVSFDAMHSPNDVVAVGPEQFYATNDRGYDQGIMSVAELYLGLPLSSAVYYDGEQGRLVKKRLTYANGINKSPDGQTIYIAEFLRRSITAYQRDFSTGELKHIKRYKIKTGPDNIDVDSEGNLWTAGHSQALKFQKHAEDATKISPSHVIKIDPKTGHSENVMISIAGEINASSVGAADRGHLYVGAVFDGHILDCRL